eukprot:9330500-Prorocentrum_lima.AAC.1
MIHAAFTQEVSEQLEDAVVPWLTPPAERVQRASSWHAGVGEQRTISSAPTQRTPPSPSERITTRSPRSRTCRVAT